jgi:hypothetical protein
LDGYITVGIQNNAGAAPKAALSPLRVKVMYSLQGEAI